MKPHVKNELNEENTDVTQSSLHTETNQVTSESPCTLALLHIGAVLGAANQGSYLDSSHGK